MVETIKNNNSQRANKSEVGLSPRFIGLARLSILHPEVFADFLQKFPDDQDALDVYHISEMLRAQQSASNKRTNK
jgi:hypothetical protein